MCGELQGEWTLYGGTTLGRTKPVGGRADMLSGKYPNKGQANTFSYFPHDAPQGLKSYPFCVRLEVSQNVCRVHEWTWAAALEISGTVIILIHGEHRSRHTVDERYAQYTHPIKLAIALTDNTKDLVLMSASAALVHRSGEINGLRG